MLKKLYTTIFLSTIVSLGILFYKAYEIHWFSAFKITLLSLLFILIYVFALKQKIKNIFTRRTDPKIVGILFMFGFIVGFFGYITANDISNSLFNNFMFVFVLMVIYEHLLNVNIMAIRHSSKMTIEPYAISTIIVFSLSIIVYAYLFNPIMLGVYGGIILMVSLISSDLIRSKYENANYFMFFKKTKV